MKAVLRGTAWIVVLTLLVAACGDDDDGGADEHAVQLTLDGERCTYDGPTEITAGEKITLTFRNRSATGGTGWMDFVRLDENKTTQDVLDFIAGDGVGRPAWTTPIISNVMSTDAVAFGTTNPLQPGLYVVVCGTNSPYAGFFGAALTVVP